MTSDDLFYKCFSTQGTYIQPLFVLDFCTRWQNCRKHVEEHQMYLQDVESSHARNYLLCSIRDFLGLHLCRHIFPCFRTKRVEWEKIHRHRRPMSQIQATIAMEQKQMRSDMIATAAAGPYTQIVQRISEDLQTRTSQEHPRRIFTQAPTQRIFKILMQGPLEKDANRISTRSSHKDLYEIM